MSQPLYMQLACSQYGELAKNSKVLVLCYYYTNIDFIYHSN